MESRSRAPAQLVLALGGDDDVEGRAVLGQDPALAVEEGAARGGDGQGADAVVLGEVAEVLPADDLQVPEVDEQDRPRPGPPAPARRPGAAGRCAGPRRSSRARRPPAHLPVHRLEDHHPHRPVHERARDEPERAQLVGLHVEDLAPAARTAAASTTVATISTSSRGRRLAEVEARGPHAHAEADQHLAQPAEAQDAARRSGRPAPSPPPPPPACRGPRRRSAHSRPRRAGRDRTPAPAWAARGRARSARGGRPGWRAAVQKTLIVRRDCSCRRARGGLGLGGPDLLRQLEVVGLRCARPCSSSSRSKWAEGATRMSLKRPARRLHRLHAPHHEALGEHAIEAGGHHHVAHRHVGQHGHELHGQQVAARGRRSPACPETTAVMRLRSMRTPRPLSWSSRSCTLAARGPHRDHAPHHAGGADDGRVQGDAVRASAVEGHRAVPGHAVGGDDLGQQGVEGQRGLDVGDLAQAVGLAQPVLLPLQLHLQARPRARAGPRSRGRRGAGRRSRDQVASTAPRPAPTMRCSGESTAKTRWPRSEVPPPALHLPADEHEMGEHEPAEQEAAAAGLDPVRSAWPRPAG